MRHSDDAIHPRLVSEPPPPFRAAIRYDRIPPAAPSISSRRSLQNGEAAGLTCIHLLARRDARELAIRLHHDLNSHGFAPWMDTERIDGGASWGVLIECAIDEADARSD